MATYTVQVEWVRTTNETTGEVQLDGLVPLDDIDASLGEELLGSMSTTHDLEQDRNSGRSENDTVDAEKECVLIESHGKIEDVVGGEGSGIARREDIGHRVQLGLDEFDHSRLLSGCGLRVARAAVSEDSRIDSTVEGRVQAPVTRVR